MATITAATVATHPDGQSLTARSDTLFTPNVRVAPVAESEILTKEAVRLATQGTATGVACEGCPPLAELTKRYEAAGGLYYVCPICFNAKNLDADSLVAGAELAGTMPMWQWIGEGTATTFSF